MSKKSSTFALAFEKEATGSSSARLECLLWEQEVVSSNLAYPTNQKKPLKNEWLLYFFFNYQKIFVIFFAKKYILLNYILQYQHFSTRISRKLVV